ncbi:hypothetical protein HX021_03450 [Sphingobacterium sp. N143]|uniref:hypothetical protein n=1 Tax=Sphingobacterium sp. N143 TaxID=2746727 RepID=UPI00257761A2|nr:hypothetical protein [Sphingobacterium sp. N143]MDM1293348.1 hypothetical protein [Sphingobacterium sp. N143]
MEKNELYFHVDMLRKTYDAILEQDEAYYTKQLKFFRSLIEEGQLNEFPEEIITKTVTIFNQIAGLADGQNLTISDSAFTELDVEYKKFEQSK